MRRNGKRYHTKKNYKNLELCLCDFDEIWSPIGFLYLTKNYRNGKKCHFYYYIPPIFCA